MRPTIKPESIPEQLGLWLNLVPTPAAEAMFGMGIARVVMAGQKLEIFRELARKPQTESGIAESCGLTLTGVRHLLRCLQVLEHVSESAGLFTLSARARKWLDPASKTYIGTFLEFNYDQWEWWSRLEDNLRGVGSASIHDHSANDPYWRRYITAMFELARLSAPEVARRIKLPPNAERILDVGGGHGWFAAEICRRNPGVEATVLDLPGSAAIGREIIAASNMSDRVRHVEGDILKDDPGGTYDAALSFQIAHHLTPEQNRLLFEKLYVALNPGGLLAVLDYMEPSNAGRPDSSAFLGLHFHLTSGSRNYTMGDVRGWLSESGFSPPKQSHLRTLPLQSLLIARKP